MPTIIIDESKKEFFRYLKKLFKGIDKSIDPIQDYNKYEILLIKSTSKKSRSKLYGALIKAE